MLVQNALRRHCARARNTAGAASGIELSLIESAGLKNLSRIAQMRGLVLLPRSFVSAWSLIRQFRPDVVVGAGGYVSGPVVLMAALTNRRTLVMESNALPG